MSGTNPAPGEPSMDDILASIRKILNEDESPGTDAEAIQLTPEMMVEPPSAIPPARTPTSIMPPPAVIVPAPMMQLERAPMALEPTRAPAVAPPGLLDPMAAAAAVAALDQLTRAVAQDRTASISRQGPTIEDVVREEMRPLLKAWLDAHLPPMVERMVRAEIERVMSRQG